MTVAILSKGYKVPESGVDKGDVFFPALEFDIKRLNDHDHDGVNSQTLAKQTQETSTWTALGGGNYRQLITMPVGLFVDTSMIQVRNKATGDMIYSTIEKLGENTFYVYTNDNTLDYVIIYL